MQINYFSPLLPARSGISEVAEQVIPALSRYAAVTVWTEQSEWSPAIERYAKVQQYDWSDIAWRQLNQADLNVYHLGNNIHYHHSIWQICRQVPGLVVLHDPKLQHLFYGVYCVRRGDGEGYVNGISQRYGMEAGVVARRFLAGELSIAAVDAYPMTEWALENAAAVMVHTQTALTELAAADRWTVGYQPLAYAPPGPATPPKRLSAPYHLIIFGYIGHNRRLEAILEALSRLPERRQFRLDIYGNLEDEAATLALIERFGLGNLVNLYGYVEDEALDQALSQASLAINLRYPTMGEASLSQLRIWQHALPTLVTQVGWYAEQPDDTVVHIRPESEISDLQHHLGQFLVRPQDYAAMGQRGRDRLEKMHSPDAYARAIVAFANQISPGYQNLTNQYWLERLSQQLHRWKSSQLSDTALARISEAIHFFNPDERYDCT
jgi:glycosyltransferase involved in cell wall biosynthesis